MTLMGHGQLVRADKLSPLRVGIVARHGSFRSILPFLGVRIVLKRFASFRSVLVSIGVRIILRLLRRR